MSDSDRSENKTLDILKELQPVAFLLSMSLVIASFFANPASGINKSSLTSILIGSVFFFFSYIGFFCSQKTNFRLFLYYGEYSLVFGAFFILIGFLNIVSKLDHEVSDATSVYSYLLIYGFIIVISLYLLQKAEIKKRNKFFEVWSYLNCILFFLVPISFILNTKSHTFMFFFILVSISTPVNILTLTVIRLWKKILIFSGDEKIATRE